MTKAQRKINDEALELDPERSRREARDAHRRKFMEGLLALDYGVRAFAVTPHERLQEIIEPFIRALEAGDASPQLLFWKTVDYIGSFDMQYAYDEPLVTGTDEQTGEPIYEIVPTSDSLDEVSLTETLRTLLTRLLAAGGALAKSVESDTRKQWVDLIMEINFSNRSDYYLFSTSYPFDAFRTRLEGLLARLWAEVKIARAHPPLV